MGKIILDERLRSQLNGLNATVEVCEPSGKTVGQFIPQDLYLKLLYNWAQDQVSDSELDAASRENGGLPLSQVWDRLGRK